MCVPDSRSLLRAYRRVLSGRAGVHLQLTGGIPCAPPVSAPSLVDRRDAFPHHRRSLGPLRPDEILREWTAQVESFVDIGLLPTHIDAHQHVHKEPAAFNAYCAIARRYGIPARSCSPAMTAALRAAGVDCPDAFACGWTGGPCTLQGLLDCVDGSFARCGGAGTVELMCHPGYADSELRQRSTLVEARERELATLCDPQLAGLLAARHIGVVPRRAAAALDVGR